MPKRVAMGEVVRREIGVWRKVRCGHGARNFERLDTPMVLAVELAKERGWDRGNPWVMSAKWSRPRQVRLVRPDRVHVATRRADGTLVGQRPTKRFPRDVHEVPAP